MSFLDTIRSRRAGGRGEASPEAAASEADQALTDRYAKLNDREAVAALAGLSQTELTAIASFERSHRDRDAVRDKLRYLRQPEPLPGYDALDPSAIPAALAAADADTVKAVRAYERKHQNRTAVNVALASVLKSLTDQSKPGTDSVPALPVIDGPPADGNGGLRIKTPPETGLGTP